jgi:hypothetical protein
MGYSFTGVMVVVALLAAVTSVIYQLVGCIRNRKQKNSPEIKDEQSKLIEK